MTRERLLSIIEYAKTEYNEGDNVYLYGNTLEGFEELIAVLNREDIAYYDDFDEIDEPYPVCLTETFGVI